MCVVSSLPPKLSMGYTVEHHTRAEPTEVQQRGKKKSTSRKKECADAFKCPCVKPQALLWLWEASKKPVA